MAVIAIGDCTVTTETVVSGGKWYKIVTPATADDGDTISLSTLFPNECLMAIATGATDGALACVISSSTTIALPGSTDNEARTIVAFGN